MPTSAEVNVAACSLVFELGWPSAVKSTTQISSSNSGIVVGRISDPAEVLATQVDLWYSM